MKFHPDSAAPASYVTVEEDDNSNDDWETMRSGGYYRNDDWLGLRRLGLSWYYPPYYWGGVYYHFHWRTYGYGSWYNRTPAFTELRKDLWTICVGLAPVTPRYRYLCSRRFRVWTIRSSRRGTGL